MVNLQHNVKALPAIFVMTLLALIFMGPVGCEKEYPETVTSCQPDFGNDTTYTGGLAGIVLTPGGECTFQIDRENSRRFNFRSWVANSSGQTVKFRIYVDQYAVVERVELLNGADLQNWVPYFEIENFVRNNWRFKDPCYYGWITYTFNPISLRIDIDRSGMIEIPRGWEGCDRSIGNRLCFVSRYRDDYGRWRPSIQVVN